MVDSLCAGILTIASVKRCSALPW